MVLSKRERYIAVATAAVVGILVLDRFVVTPVYNRKVEMEALTQQKLAELEHARLLFARKRQLAPKWQVMQKSGLSDLPAEAESRVLHAIRNWSSEAGLSLSSLRPERSGLLARPNTRKNVATPKKDQPDAEALNEITFRASGTGRMGAVKGFLERLESSSMPIRITDFQLGTRKEGTDDLSLQLRISALCHAPAAEAAPDKRTVRAASTETTHE